MSAESKERPTMMTTQGNLKDIDINIATSSRTVDETNKSPSGAPSPKKKKKIKKKDRSVSAKSKRNVSPQLLTADKS